MVVTGAIEEINIGDLVKWYDYYAEGDIVRDAGLGMVLRILQKPVPPYSGSKGESELYLVQRMGRPNQEWYASHAIDIIAKGEGKKPDD